MFTWNCFFEKQMKIFSKNWKSVLLDPFNQNLCRNKQRNKGTDGWINEQTNTGKIRRSKNE